MKHRIAGAIAIIAAFALAIGYTYLMLFTDMWQLVVRYTLVAAVLLVSLIIGWVGYILLTTPSPKTLKEIEREIEEEIRKLEEMQKEGKAGGEKS